MASKQIKELIDVADIWPDTDFTVRLILGRVDGESPFAIWAETVPDELIFISQKLFSTESEARSAFKLLTEVLVETRDPAIDFLKNTPLTRRQ